MAARIHGLRQRGCSRPGQNGGALNSAGIATSTETAHPMRIPPVALGTAVSLLVAAARALMGCDAAVTITDASPTSNVGEEAALVT
jgi:hypothetical protein